MIKDQVKRKARESTKTDKRMIMSFAVRQSVKDSIQTLAKMQGVSASFLMDMALAKYIETQKGKLI